MTQLPDTSTEAGQREASVMLARLMPDWEIEPGDHGKMWIKCPDYPHATTNLYQPVFMFLAWKALNWAFNNLPGDTGQAQNFFEFLQAREYWEQQFLWSMPPAAAQRAWLDKILALATEAGMIEAQP